MRREDQRGGNGSVPGTRRKAVPIGLNTNIGDYCYGDGTCRIHRRATSATGETDGKCPGM